MILTQSPAEIQCFTAREDTAVKPYPGARRFDPDNPDLYESMCLMIK